MEAQDGSIDNRAVLINVEVSFAPRLLGGTHRTQRQDALAITSSAIRAAELIHRGEERSVALRVAMAATGVVNVAVCACFPSKSTRRNPDSAVPDLLCDVSKQ